MKTTIDIPDAALADAMRFTGAKTKREAVVKALEAYNRQQRVNDLIANFGTLDFASNDEIEAGAAANDQDFFIGLEGEALDRGAATGPQDHRQGVVERGVEIVAATVEAVGVHGTQVVAVVASSARWARR